MSRCFPYPPPGFEKKARSDHSDLLAKEKQKEREHKKEKRDKEKKARKEKKDKDKSRNKYKEKKDRKERHKDKQRGQDKNRTPDGKRIEGPGGCNERNVGSTFSEELGWRNKDEKGAANRMLVFAGSISKVEEVDDSRFTKELGRRMEVEKKVAASRMLENITGSIPKRVESLGASTALEKERGNGKPVVANFVSNGKRKAGEVSRPPEKANYHHQALHNHQGLPNGNPTVANFSKEQRRADGVSHPVEKDNHKRQALSHRTPVVSNCVSTEQRRVDGITRAVDKGSRNHQPLLQTPDRQALLQTPAEKDEVRSIERKKKGKDRKADNGHGDRSKDREREEKKNKGKDKNRDKEKEEEEEEEEEEKRVNGENSYDTPKGRGRDQVDILKFKPLAPHNNNENFAGNHGNSKKRKEIELNGFLHGEVPPKKLPRPASPSHLQNGKTLEFDHIHTTYPSSIRHGSQNIIKAERLVKSEERTMNGSVATQPSPADLKPLIAVDLKLSLAAVAQPSPADLQPSVAAVAQPSPADLKPSVAAVASSPVDSKLSLAAVAQPSPADLKPTVAAVASSPVDSKLSLAAVAQPSPAALKSSFVPLPWSSPADVKTSHAAVTQPCAAALKSSFAADARGKSKVFPKPPHPDSKFLSQIFSLPETEEWLAYDDQEWIFSSSDHQPKLKVEIEAEETPQVWAKGLKIESADVFALPYVIPY